jgi:predicted metal-dependent HD superfamily phosphohydrolase
LAVAPDGAPLGEELILRWSEPHRRYHTVDHLIAVLRHLDWLGQSTTPIRLAAWYHDVIYQPDRDDSERRSAELASTTLPAVGLGESVVSEVCRLVALTGSHSPAPEDASGAVLSDADLAVLGSSPVDYERYRRAVRVEYGHIDSARWRVGRAAVLTSMLERPYIYSTLQGRGRWEGQARRNMIEELGALSWDGGETGAGADRLPSGG